MTAEWPRVALGDVLDLSLDPVPVEAGTIYPTLGVYGFGRGVITSKPPVQGSEIAASSLYRVHQGQFIYSRLKAFEGAFAMVPPEGDGRWVTNEFPTFNLDRERVHPQYLGWLFRTRATWVSLSAESVGIGARRERLHPEQLLRFPIPLPSINQQRWLSARLDAVTYRLGSRTQFASRQDTELALMLEAAFQHLTAGCPKMRMDEVAPLLRREVTIQPDVQYTEIGIRSFYKGIFLRRTMSGAEFTWQRLYAIQPGDLVFSNLMAWERGIALAGEDAAGLVGNHRMLTCVPDADRMLPGFLFFYFTTRQGFAQIEAGSPGSSARNKTLSPEALAAIEVPVPSLADQKWFEELRLRANKVTRLNADAARDAAALLPAMLHEIFNPAAC